MDVEFIGTQEEFITIVDPSLPAEAERRLVEIKEKAARKAYTLDDEQELLADTLFMSQIATPFMFGALLSKNI